MKNLNLMKVNIVNNLLISIIKKNLNLMKVNIENNLLIYITNVIDKEF